MTIAIRCLYPARARAPGITIPRGTVETIALTVTSGGLPHDGTGGTIRLSLSAHNSSSEADIVELPGNSTGSYLLPIPANLSRRIVGTWNYQLWFIAADATETLLSDVGVVVGTPTVTPHGHLASDTALTTHRVYYGVGTAGITLPATIEAMSHADNTSQSFVAVVSPAVQKIYIAHPAAWSVPIITVGGFALDQLATSSIILHNTDGQLVVYTLHESTNLLTMTSAQIEVRFL